MDEERPSKRLKKEIDDLSVKLDEIATTILEKIDEYVTQVNREAFDDMYPSIMNGVSMVDVWDKSDESFEEWLEKYRVLHKDKIINEVFGKYYPKVEESD